MSKNIDSLMKEKDAENYEFLNLERELNDWNDYRQNVELFAILR